MPSIKDFLTYYEALKRQNVIKDKNMTDNYIQVIVMGRHSGFIQAIVMGRHSLIRNISKKRKGHGIRYTLVNK